MDTVCGMELKYLSLLTLVVQNSALVLVMRYSRTIDGPRYNTATAVVMSEFIKLAVCIIIHILSESKTRKLSLSVVLKDIFGRESNWIAMTVPAILYFIQNNLQYVAVTLLDAATFQVTYQLKIITTALFSVWLLKKSLNLKKWVSLGLLTAGIAIVQLSDGKVNNDDEKSASDKFFGLVAVAVACTLSGLAGVW
jgi:UDP-sugar transporter A1/2/3